MTGPRTLSGTMRAAAEYVREHGALCRYSGGYWQKPGGYDGQATYFGTSTVAALVKRGVADYTAWRDGQNGRYPVRCELASIRDNTPPPRLQDRFRNARTGRTAIVIREATGPTACLRLRYEGGRRVWVRMSELYDKFERIE